MCGGLANVYRIVKICGVKKTKVYCKYSCCTVGTEILYSEHVLLNASFAFLVIIIEFSQSD